MAQGERRRRSGARARGRALRALVAGAFLASCAPRAPELEVRYADALFDAPDGAALGPALRPYLCGDEAHLSRLVARPLELRARGPGRAELVVTACASRGEGAEPPASDARVELEVEPAGAAARPLVYALGADWREERFDLGELGGGELVVRATKRGAGGRNVFVRDFALRIARPRERRLATAQRVLLVSLDTFREDAIGAFGGRTRTPALDRLAGESERFRPHWAAEISTKPSHASMLTGLPYAAHGCDRLASPLAPGATTVAERLAAAGVATGAFVNAPVPLAAKYGFDRGFALYRNERWSSGPELRAATEWIARQGDRPWFAFVHLAAAHSDGVGLPYQASGSSPAAIERRFGVAGYGCRDGLCASRLLLALNFERRAARQPRDAEVLRALYDAGVEELDRDLGRFFDDLRASGVWRDTLVVLTADHGEAFDEHGYFLHTTAHEEVLRVPLLVKWPGGRDAGAVTTRPTSSLDLVPTLLAHFGLAAPGLAGEDLASREEPRQRAARPLVSRHAVLEGNWKLLVETPEHAGGLYDLERDAGERHDLRAARPAEAARLAALRERFELAAMRAQGGAAAPAGALDAAEIEELRALGYLR